ncbi:efflux transporter outer membrane subunit [Paraburkholderia sp. MMS20-SJTN17]|uniref:Efflux transporter outer membrane subunit n=1 Tax=Paraburkholderia translucens TaxID=2886945 RepID=A0ABS8KJG4_9BURK|nr:efflux transporter outer membrane subunit [Paraburkholderia sp. MMS20-SJTN17]MCC8404573.1 efflux transporter outer membrane subunit [Paraburkholderia sp. MMS20-SJTN17]
MGTDCNLPVGPASAIHRWRAAFGAAATIGLGACAFGPSGEPPAMPVPVHYGVEPQPAQTVEALGVAQRFTIGAQPAPEWWRLFESTTLNDLVDEGLRNSPTLAAADKRLAAAHEQVRGQNRSSLLPTVDLAGQASRGRDLGIPVPGGPNTLLYNEFIGVVQAQYTFDLFGAVREANAARSARVDIEAYRREAARRALATNIVTATIDAAMLRAEIDATERSIALAGDQAHDAERHYELGSLTHGDVLAARQSMATLEVSVAELRQRLTVTRHALAVLLGRTPDAAPPEPDLASLHLPQDLPVVLPSDLLRTRPDIEAAEAALKAAAADVGVATAQLFPSLTLTASMGQGGFSWPLALSGAGAIWSIGATLSQALFHGGALIAQRRAAIDAYEAAVFEYKQTVLAAFENVADTLASLEHDAQALEAASVATRAAREAFGEAASRHRLGALPASSARSGEQQYEAARLEEIRLIGRRLSETATLFQAMGELPAASNATPEHLARK